MLPVLLALASLRFTVVIGSGKDCYTNLYIQLLKNELFLVTLSQSVLKDRTENTARLSPELLYLGAVGTCLVPDLVQARPCSCGQRLLTREQQMHSHT